MDRLALDQVAEVDGDELGQLRGQALDLQFGLHVVDQALVGLHRDRVFLVDEVQRHLLVQPRGLVDALEVDVQDDLLPRVHLVVAQQHLLHVARQFHVEDRRMEGFLLQRVEQRVVVQLDHGRRAGPVDDAGHLGGGAQAAARSGPLLRTLECDELHDFTPMKGTRDQVPKQAGRKARHLKGLRMQPRAT